MAKKRQRVPEILWKMFRKRARTLGETILAIVGKCRCKRRRCLSCSRDQAMSRLLRPDDPSDYRRLIKKCFAVVSEDAPRLPPFDPHCRWPQREFVTRSIEMIISEQPSSQNLLCNGYDRESRSSAVVDILTSSTWARLLRRVGDALMLYLLKYTSIFFALPRNNFQQIAGFPISDSCHKFSRHMSDPKPEQQPLADHGLTKKRKSFEEIESTSAKRPFVGSQASSCSSYICTNGYNSVITEEISLKKADGSSNQDNVTSRKHKREYRWQRQRKRRQLIIQETSPMIVYSENCCSSDNLSTGLRDELNVDSGQNIETNVSDYPCCTGFENIRRMGRNSEIDRRNIFYRLETSASMFPKKHILYALKSNNSGAIVLFKNIFGTSGGDKNLLSDPCLHSKCTCDIKSTCLYRSIIKLLKRLISITQNCPYLKLLDKHCSITSSCSVVSNRVSCSVFEGNICETKSSLSGSVGASSEGKSLIAANAKNGKMIQESTVVQAEPSKSWCPKKQVVSFIWSICRRIVPSPLLGTPSNWIILKKNISKFIHLRKFEKFSLKDCMHKLKLSQFPLLSNARCACSELGISDIVRHAILDRWMFWFFAYLISPLIQANFYVTESENAKQEVLYYRKSTWENLMREAQKLLQDQSYHQLNHVSLRRILIRRSFGFSRARLRPKQFGFRVLANLQAPSKLRFKPPRSRIRSYPQSHIQVSCRNTKYKIFKSVNSVLRDLHVVLKGLRRSEPDKLGSSVFDYNDVYRKLVPFLFLLKNGSATMPDVFIVVSDVSKAFDSVDQKKLLSVMKDVLLDNEYTLEKFVQVIRTKRSLKCHEQQALARRDIVAESPYFRSQSAHALDSILVKKEISRIIKGEEFDMILKEHITGNVVKIHNNFYLQQVGIPQGSILSALLCSYYYGHMERNIVFPFLEKACENTSLGQNDEEMLSLASEFLLLRFVDDYLLISTSKKQASMFFSRLERGVREYNCCMNKDKYGLNFNINHGEGCRSDRLYTGKDGVSFLRWSGLLINCCTLEIQADYTRYLNSHLRSTVTVCSQGKVGRHLKEKLCDYLRPKCHPIFYDSNINSPGVVRLNIYQVFLLCAMKFICYISNLSTITKFSPSFYFNVIAASLRYMNRLVKRRMYSRLSGITFRPKYDVKKKEITWLGLYAYTQVLKKKQSCYKELLRLFMSKLKAHEKGENISSELNYAITASHSSALWSIKY